MSLAKQITEKLTGGRKPTCVFCAPFFSFSFRRKKRTAAASEEACSIPLPPGRRKLHIRSLLLPSRKPTAALGRLSVPIRKGKRRPGNLRMVPRPLHRPEPCSGLAAYGSRKTYDRICRGRCRAQLFATKERYRCGLPLAGTHRPLQAQPKCGAGSEEAKRLPLDRGRRLI